MARISPGIRKLMNMWQQSMMCLLELALVAHLSKKGNADFLTVCSGILTSFEPYFNSSNGPLQSCVKSWTWNLSSSFRHVFVMCDACFNPHQRAIHMLHLTKEKLNKISPQMSPTCDILLCFSGSWLCIISKGRGLLDRVFQPKIKHMPWMQIHP